MKRRGLGSIQSRNVATHVTTGAPESKAWVEIAPGVSFGAQALPRPWYRWWAKVLLGWTWRTHRNPNPES